MYTLSYKMVYENGSEFYNEEEFDTYEECIEARKEMKEFGLSVEFTHFRINYTEEETYYQKGSGKHVYVNL